MSDKVFDAVIVAGSRHWTNWGVVWRALGKHIWGQGLLIHGACRGADQIAAEYCHVHGCEIEAFPYISTMGLAGGPQRNQQMLDRLIVEQRKGLRTDIALLAFHDDPNVETAKKGGTADMIRRTRKAGVPYLLFRSEAVAPREDETR